MMIKEEDTDDVDDEKKRRKKRKKMNGEEKRKVGGNKKGKKWLDKEGKEANKTGEDDDFMFTIVITNLTKFDGDDSDHDNDEIART